MPKGEGILTSVRDGVTTVTIRRVEQRNAISNDDCHELMSILETAAGDSRVRALVITGDGRYFCTGAAVLAGPGTSSTSVSPLDYRNASVPYQRLFQLLWEFEKPVVSAVNGTVAGAGWLLALLGDLVVAAQGGRWKHVFVERGMIPHAGDPFFLPRLLPLHRLNEIAMLGDLVHSEDLERWGVINRIVPAESVLDEALVLAERLAQGPTRTLGLTKRLYRRSLDLDLATAFLEERDASALLTTTRDRTEGVKAFFESRPPRFTGE